MKKFTFLFFLALAMMMPALADNYLTMGVNDTVSYAPEAVKKC